MDPGHWILPYAITNAGMLSLAFICWRWKGAGRILFVLLFLGAAGVNAATALYRPADYLAFAYTTWSEAYRAFILGFFGRHVSLIVSLIAAGQLAIAVLLAGKGWAVRAGLAGAMVFFAAIAPLGIGSAFPSTLIAACAAALLWSRAFTSAFPFAWIHSRRKWRVRRLRENPRAVA